jgi:hypothetical protein
VHTFISREYLRCAAILAASQPKNGYHEGWGDIGMPTFVRVTALLKMPLGTEWEGVRLRRRLLDTIHELSEYLLCLVRFHVTYLAHRRCCRRHSAEISAHPTDDTNS